MTSDAADETLVLAVLNDASQRYLAQPTTSARKAVATPGADGPPLEVGAMTSRAIPTSAAGESIIIDLIHASSRSVRVPMAVGTLVRIRRLNARAPSSSGAERRYGTRR